MKLAVQNPFFIFGDQTRNFNGYNFEFVRQFRPVLYFQISRIRSGMLGKVSRYRFRRQVHSALKRIGLDSRDFQVVFQSDELNRQADVLLCFNGRPDLPDDTPPVGFTGMKIFHVMDYVFCADDSHRALCAGGADYVMGYADHGRHCAFFRHYYPSYVEKIIPVPFGFGRRFANMVPWSQRIRKVIALGSVNPVDDPAVEDRALLDEYRNFYSDKRWTHEWRRLLSENAASLDGLIDSLLPVFPRTKDFTYDAVAMLNKYAMYANDEGLMAFPPARTYEGVAAGAILVCADHPCYADIGFEDGENCIMHRRLDIKDFERKVDYYRARPDRMARVASAGTDMVRRKYSHVEVAKSLHAEILLKWEGR